MNDIEIKEYDPNYDLYSELLIKKAEIKKEGYQYYMDYLRVFGELINTAYEAKIECIKKKKLIEFYQAKINKNEDVDTNQADRYIEAVMDTYYKTLETMRNEYTLSKSFEFCSSEEIRQVKDTYRKLAKLIHPDMNKIYSDDRKIQEFWMDVCNAYQNNRLEEIQELEITICKYLSDIGYDCETIEIADIENKISILENEIEDLMNSNPYLYKLLMDNEDAVSMKKQELEDEIEESIDYQKDLEYELNNLLDSNTFIKVECYA